MKVLLILAGLMMIAFTSFRSAETVQRQEKLSAYGFFKGPLAALQPALSADRPADKIIPYTVNTPLFSNYAEKLRFIRLPEGSSAVYNDSASFEFPVGTILIKNFYYPIDFRKPEKGRRILETRLLVLQEEGWEAWPYTWNEEQTEAYYDPAGETKDIVYTNAAGKKISTRYVIPNKNQCKGCHARGKEMKPIGTSARQLNGDLQYSSGKENQLEYWKNAGMLTSLPDLAIAPKLAVWNDPSSGDLNARARAYLDANCGHCHSRSGPANTSGLFLNIDEKDKTHLGVNKPPVAAGRGAGDLHVDIVPGQPQRSILVFRMKTNDPAIAMPEIGREQVDKEGVELIEEWIRKNKF
jgi:uncharacterized repeat protein (TIGR03806 family)